MIAKLVVWGEDRSAALKKLRYCLRQYNVRNPPVRCAHFIPRKKTTLFLAVAFLSVSSSDRGSQHQHRLPAEPLGPPAVRSRKREHQFHPAALRRPLPRSTAAVRGHHLPGRPGPGAAGEETHAGVHAVLRRSVP